MFDIVKKELNVSIVSSIIYIILGIVIVLNPEQTLKSIGIAIAWFSIIFGIIFTIINITKLKKEGSLLFGIILIVIGIALLIYPNSLNLLISLGVGIWFISSSVSRIKVAIMLKNAKEINWLIILIPAIITLTVGLAFVFAPLASAVTLAIITGVLMIVYALIDIFEIVFMKKNIKEIEKVLVEK